MRLSILLGGMLCCRGVAADFPPVTGQREGTQVVFRSGSHEVGRYQAEAGELPRPGIAERFRRGGYLHPLLTPSGRSVTDDFPANHLHHHGVWSPWARTEFEGRNPDFWNMGDGTGRVEFLAVDRLWNDVSGAGLMARHNFVDLVAVPPKVVLAETWEVRASVCSGPRTAFQWDWKSTQRCSGNSPLTLPEYRYGGFGFRGNWAWNGANHGLFLTSEGETNRVRINTSRARWFWMGGPVEGSIAGMAVLGHPSNFRFPQPIRLHPEEPFFCFAPQQLGVMTIRPGEPYEARYRLLVMDGFPDRESLEAMWKEYAAVP
ncbi:MAG: PmoA family protein [Verrucomicrobiales bacterium]|nr:PmoA family protein [Verrucomicrobiales bacterium]